MKNEDLIQTKKYLEKELSKSKTDYELKVIDLKNHEVLIQKKAAETEELKAKIERIGKDDSINNTINNHNTIQQINSKYEKENERLKNDLKELRELNLHLNEKLENLNFSSGKSNNDQLFNEYQERLRLAEEELKLKDFTIKRLVNENKQIQCNKNNE